MTKIKLRQVGAFLDAVKVTGTDENLREIEEVLSDGYWNVKANKTSDTEVSILWEREKYTYSYSAPIGHYVAMNGLTKNGSFVLPENVIGRDYELLKSNEADEEIFQEWRKYAQMENMTLGSQTFAKWLLSDAIRDKMMMIGAFNKIFQSIRRFLKQ
jgi:hypothetical protein